MESQSIRIYRDIMRRLLLNNIALFMAVSLVWADTTPHFLVLNSNTNFNQTVQTLQEKGVVITKRVPPRVLVANLPDGVDAGSVSGLQTYYLSAVPIDTLVSFGPLAIAAGRRWNQELLSRPRQRGFSASSAMRTLVSQSSLGAPQNMKLTQNNQSFVCEWDPIYGALLYEIQASEQPDFKTFFMNSHAYKTQARGPIPESNGTLYVRVRALEDDLKGTWSNVMQLNFSGAARPSNLMAPTLTSPIDLYESEGFTLILEWAGHTGESTRVQLAAAEDFGSILVDEVVSDGEFVLPSSLLKEGNQYYWRVQAFGSTQSPWSSARQFRVNAPRHIGADTFINPERPK